MSITAQLYGRTAAGDDVYQYTMTNDDGVVVKIIEYGCIVTNILVPDANGTQQDVVWGYDTLEDYENGTCHFGAFVGRYANRIENAVFTLGDKTYQLPVNNGKNHLHGTFERKIFKGSIEDDALVLTAHSPNGEEGYPGNMDITVTYTLTDEGALVMDYIATCDALTVINFTNHSYFNLNGQNGAALDKHTLCISASRFTEGNAETCPTGRILPVAGTPMDFTTPKPIAMDMEDDYEQLRLAGGYDHNYVLDKEPGMLAQVATAKGLETGIVMEVLTTQPGMQLYSGNYLGSDVPAGKNGVRYAKRSAFCLETQHYPCSPSHAEFPSVLLAPDEEYHETTIYRFSVQR